MFIPINLCLLLVIVIIRTVKGEMEGKVVRGNPAKIKDFPHSAYLKIECTSAWICSASILNQWVLLTASHCVSKCFEEDKKTDKLEVFVGHEDITRVKIMRKVIDTIFHENYDDITLEHDIGLVMVKDKIPFSDTIKRIIINERWTRDGYNGFVAGWGVVDESVNPPKSSVQLLSVNQKIRSDKICSLLDITPGMFCAGSVTAGDPHPASGDSGSAYVYKKVYQIGLVSFNVNDYPALMVYTNVTYYYRWIKKKSERIYCKNMRLA